MTAHDDLHSGDADPTPAFDAPRNIKRSALRAELHCNGKSGKLHEGDTTKRDVDVKLQSQSRKHLWYLVGICGRLLVSASPCQLVSNAGDAAIRTRSQTV